MDTEQCMMLMAVMSNTALDNSTIYNIEGIKHEPMYSYVTPCCHLNFLLIVMKKGKKRNTLHISGETVRNKEIKIDRLHRSIKEKKNNNMLEN